LYRIGVVETKIDNLAVRIVRHGETWYASFLHTQ
jgi:hypothetical protein